MPEKEDHLSNEVTIAAAFDAENNTITAGMRSRAVSSIDRLIGAVIDIPTALLEEKANRIRSNGDNEGMPLLLSQEDRIDAGIRERDLRKLVNKKKVVEAALDDIRTSSEKPEDNDEPMSEDWLNYFESHAENVSSGEVQELWAKVLAGEIRKPRSFSLRTLRLLSEIDETTAKSFENFVRDRINDRQILKGEALEGVDLAEAIELEEAGLLQEVVNSNLIQRARMDDNSQYLFIDGEFIAVINACEGITTISYPFIKITRIGEELCRLLLPRNPIECLEMLSQYFIDKGVVDKAVLGKIEEQNGDQIRYGIIKEMNNLSEESGS